MGATRGPTSPAARLDYTVFPGHAPFVDCTRLDGRPISPVQAHQLLVDVGHEDGALTFMSENWADRIERRRPI